MGRRDLEGPQVTPFSPVILNPESINPIGYLGLALAGAVLVCWLAYWKMKRRGLARLGFALGLAAFASAWMHSTTHVSRIEIDPSAKLAEMKARQEAREQAALDSRGEEVAQIRFAEDDGDEFLDKAGLEESDLKYLDSLDEPEWKREKKSRSAEGAEDDSLEALIDDEETEGGADVAVLEAEQGPEPILMSEAEVIAARRLDRWNLRSSLALPFIALLVLGYDYLRRANRYAEASLPLPMPSRLTGAVTAMPAVVERPDPPRRPVVGELAWIARRGDAFLYLTDDPMKAEKALERLARFAAKRRRFEILHIKDDGIDDDFVFESLWFGRASYVVDSPERARSIMHRFTELLKQRAAARAHTRQIAHIVWDLREPMPEERLEPLIQLARSTGFSLFLCHRESKRPQ